jgi:hypothetical protein
MRINEMGTRFYAIKTVDKALTARHFAMIPYNRIPDQRKENAEMTNNAGHNESRTLVDGEIVHLVQHPGAKWKIRFYECRHHVRIAGSGGKEFVFLEVLPKDWKDREFDSADAAAAFVQEQIKQGAVPKNSKQTNSGN